MKNIGERLRMKRKSLKSNTMSEVKGVPKNSNQLDELYPSLAHSTLTLFNALPVDNAKTENPSKKLTKLTMEHGFIFAPQVVANYPKLELESMITQISDEIGLTPNQMNSTFNKSWAKVRDAPYFQLLSEQVYHYMTTYGYKAMGVYDERTVFIPNEHLDVPEIKDGIKLTVINGYTKKQLREKILKMLNSGMALSTIDELVTVAKYSKLTDDEVLGLNNKEVRVRMYVEMDLIPEDPLDLLRLALYETIERTLLINNKATTELIKNSDKQMTDLFDQYDENFGYIRLAEIFNRFKPLFLAFKETGEDMPNIINMIGRLSKKYHKPMKPSYLNDITGMLNRNEKIDAKRLMVELDKVNIFRKIRLTQSLSYRMSGNKSIVYKIRNGKSYATKFDFTNIKGAEKAFETIVNSIAKDLKHLKGKEIYIPENLVYAIPATAKQFSGNIPSGSYVRVGKDMIFGIWWTNVQGQTDLDLHASSQNVGHIGWNTTQRSRNHSLLRTGDITDAPNGAVELFHIDKDYSDEVLFNLNYYNFRKDVPVPYKLMIAEEHPSQFDSNYTIDPNNMKCLIKSVIDVQQQTLGLGSVKDGECRFYFSEGSLGNENVVKGYEYIELARDYMSHFFKSQITFNEILEEIGAKLIKKPTKKCIDLSPENLQKDTFINLLIKQ